MTSSSSRITSPVKESVSRIVSISSPKKSKEIIKVDKRYYRPSDVIYLKGNSAKARNSLGWFPKYNFKQLVKEMIDSDMKKAQLEMTLKRNYEKN